MLFENKNHSPFAGRFFGISFTSYFHRCRSKDDKTLKSGYFTRKKKKKISREKNVNEKSKSKKKKKKRKEKKKVRYKSMERMKTNGQRRKEIVARFGNDFLSVLFNTRAILTKH